MTFLEAFLTSLILGSLPFVLLWIADTGEPVAKANDPHGCERSHGEVSTGGGA